MFANNSCSLSQKTPHFFDNGFWQLALVVRLLSLAQIVVQFLRAVKLAIAGIFLFLLFIFGRQNGFRLLRFFSDDLGNLFEA